MRSASEIAALLGGKVTGPNSVHCPGPGHSQNDESLHVTLTPDAPDGFVVHDFSGRVDWRDAKDYVASRLGLRKWTPGNARDHDRVVTNIEAQQRKRDQHEQQQAALARALWLEGIDPRGTLAEAYLKLRCLALPDQLAMRCLRFHPGAPWRCENTGGRIRVPALLAPYRSLDDDTITAVQRIALNPDGSKHDRRMLGPVRRTAVKFDTVDAGTLWIGEGVETALAARQLGYRPVWCLGSAVNIGNFPVLDDVKHLGVLGENDTGASEENISKVAQRYRAAGKQFSCVFPEGDNKDFNDSLMKDSAHGA